MAAVVQISTLADSRAPSRGSGTTSGSSASQHNPRLEENETIEPENPNDPKKDYINDVEAVDADGMESDRMEDSSF
ncbi:uncharacterized protein VTP21DRAFT_5551 [Calcarisporiella thermophila]|uniref:uncharacterized protein n=1 Tax=Calcarisporiella thermophila TaxID=911321 RepID=UPI00374423FB